MRSYLSNSPQAAARIIALAMLADGHLSRAELEDLVAQGVHGQLGLQPEELFAVVQTCCEDLLAVTQLTWADACRVDARTLSGLMAEIDDPALRLKVLALCISVVEADNFVAEGESAVLGAAVEHWGLQRAMFERPATRGSVHHA